MRKILSITGLLLLLCWSILFSVDKEQQEQWLNVLAEKDPQIKLQKLDEYFGIYGEKEDKYTPYMYLCYALATYQLQQFDKTIQYGEKALTYKEIEANNKLQIYLSLANAYMMTQKDLDKAYEYASLLIGEAKALRGNAEKSPLDTQYIAPALRIQTRILETKPADLNYTTEALQKSLEAFKVDQSEKSSLYVIRWAERLFKLNKIDEPIAALETLCQATPNADAAHLLAFWYDKKGDKPKAVEYLKVSYNLKHNAKVAYDLGVLLQKIDIDSALNYLAECFVVNDEKYSPKAQELLQHLFFNVKTKGMAAEEQEKVFQELLSAAKLRLGIS